MNGRRMNALRPLSVASVARMQRSGIQGTFILHIPHHLIQRILPNFLVTHPF